MIDLEQTLYLGGALLILAGTIMALARALNKTGDTIRDQGDTIHALNAELRLSIEERHRGEAERRQLQGDLTKVQTCDQENRRAIEQVTTELIKLKGQRKQDQVESTEVLGRLRVDLEQARQEIKKYQETIRRLEIEVGQLTHTLNETKNAKRAAESLLNAQREEMQQQINALRVRLELAEQKANQVQEAGETASNPGEPEEKKQP